MMSESHPLFRSVYCALNTFLKCLGFFLALTLTMMLLLSYHSSLTPFTSGVPHTVQDASVIWLQLFLVQPGAFENPGHSKQWSSQSESSYLKIKMLLPYHLPKFILPSCSMAPVHHFCPEKNVFSCFFTISHFSKVVPGTNEERLHLLTCSL